MLVPSGPMRKPLVPSESAVMEGPMRRTYGKAVGPKWALLEGPNGGPFWRALLDGPFGVLALGNLQQQEKQ